MRRPHPIVMWVWLGIAVAIWVAAQQHALIVAIKRSITDAEVGRAKATELLKENNRLVRELNERKCP